MFYMYYVLFNLQNSPLELSLTGPLLANKETMAERASTWQNLEPNSVVFLGALLLAPPPHAASYMKVP